jgi:uncharacterized protein YciI
MLLLCLALLASSLPAVAQDAPLDMMTYQMVLLKKGPVAPPSAPADQQRMQNEHLAGLAELNRKRINLIYGPILAESDLRGIAVLDVPDAETAKKHFAGDPFVKANMMTVEVRPLMAPKGWFGVPPSYDVTNPANLERFVFGFLVRVPDAPAQDKAIAEEIQKGHLAYMESLHARGKLVMAGPFLDDGPARGVVVYRVNEIADAMALAANDPAVKAGRLRLQAYPWMTFKGILK